MNKLYSYVRWSSDKQTGNTSLARQTAKAALFAQEHDLELVEMIDAGLSAFKGKNTTPESALGGFIRAVESGAIPSDSWLYVENLDRLSRQEITLANELFLRLLNLGLTVVTGMDGRVYTRESVNAQPTDLMISILLFSRANEESKTKQKRVYGHVAALVERFKRGETVNIKSAGSAPWWIDASGPATSEVKEHPVHWVAAKEAVRLFLSGYGAYRVAAAFDSQPDKYPPPKGMKSQGALGWPVANIAAMRRNRALIGERNINIGGVKYRLDGYYPPVCTPAEFAQIQEIVVNNRITQGSRKKRITLLSGLHILKCGRCGGAMTFFCQDDKIRYVCENGKRRQNICRVWSVQGRLVEHTLMFALVRGYIGMMMRGNLQSESLTTIIDSRMSELNIIQKQIDNITSAIALGGNLSSLVERLVSLEKQKDVLTVEIEKMKTRQLISNSREQLVEKITDTVELLTPEMLFDITHPDRTKLREVVRAVIKSVTLDKRNDRGIVIRYELHDNTTYLFEAAGKNDYKETLYVVDNDGNPISAEALIDERNEHTKKIIGLENSLHANIVTILHKFPPIDGKAFWTER